MKLHTLRTALTLPVDLQTAWDFFSDASNLPRITPPWMGFQVASPLPERMHPGMIATYRVRIAPGVRVGWVTEITHVREPHLFVDEQRFGPYRFWHHQHHFREAGDGTEVRDIVHYAAPFGPLGRVANRIRVAAQVREIFDFREAELHRIFPPR